MEIGDLITLGNDHYVLILSFANYNDVTYAFVNEVDKNKELTENYSIMSIGNNTMKKIVDEDIINMLLPTFSKNVQGIINNNDFSN